jgi:hypothetical protein
MEVAPLLPSTGSGHLLPQFRRRDVPCGDPHINRIPFTEYN